MEMSGNVSKRVETDGDKERYKKKQKVFNGQKYRELSRQKKIKIGRNEVETSWNKNI